MAIVKDLETLNADIQEQKERVENVDFKMITFSLAGKDYGVNIMNVKEIAKADKFTFVPNAASFIRGVYNLRGDIIPIIDLRNFFHLPIEKKEENMENMLILIIDDRVYGTIVDKIDKVVGINSEQIQPPHPIFGDINIKFISGVVEKQGELYIILDVVRIFSINNKDEESKTRMPETSVFQMPSSAEPALASASAGDESALGFIQQSLPKLKHFYPSIINEAWLRERYADWSIGRQGANLQLKDVRDAEDFLSKFYSPCSGTFWRADYADAVKAVLPDNSASIIQVWNIGCGKGYETFSFACILKSKYPNSRFKIWANDSDIMAISQAPNMFYEILDVPEYCRAYMAKGPSGYTFNQEIKDSVLFEYHDILNENSLPDLDIIVARDILSFVSTADQGKVLAEFSERLKSHGMVFLGTSEELSDTEWRSTAKAPVSAFMKRA